MELPPGVSRLVKHLISMHMPDHSILVAVHVRLVTVGQLPWVTFVWGSSS